MNTPDEPAPLAGLRLLIVEDEMVLAMALQDLLEMVDCTVVKAPSVKKALAAIENEQIDGALLDVNVRGGYVYPVAEELRRRGISFAFMTGYDESAIDDDWRDRPVLRKPFDLEALERIAAPFAESGRK